MIKLSVTACGTSSFVGQYQGREYTGEYRIFWDGSCPMPQVLGAVVQTETGEYRDVPLEQLDYEHIERQIIDFGLESDWYEDRISSLADTDFDMER